MAFGKKDINHDFVMKCSLVAGGVVLMVIVGLLAMWIKGQQLAGPSAKPAAPQHVETIRYIEPPSVSDVMDTVRSAVALSDAQLVTNFFHLGAATQQEAIAYLKRNQDEVVGEKQFHWLGSVVADGLPMAVVKIVANTNDQLRVNLALLWPGEDGIWKIDFPAYARVTSPAWEQILCGEASGTVRVEAYLGNYYNGIFADSEWICYRLESADVSKWLYGYCRRNSRQARAMREVISSNALQGMGQYSRDGGVRVVLEIRRPTLARDNQFEIKQVVAQDWVIQDEPFENRIADPE